MKHRIMTVMFVIGLCIVNVAMAAPKSFEVRALAKEAFIYAYPMLYNYKTLQEQTQDQFFSAYIGGFGRFRHYSESYTLAFME